MVRKLSSAGVTEAALEPGILTRAHEPMCHTGAGFAFPRDFETPGTLKAIRNARFAKVVWPMPFRWLSKETQLDAALP